MQVILNEEYKGHVWLLSSPPIDRPITHIASSSTISTEIERPPRTYLTCLLNSIDYQSAP